MTKPVKFLVLFITLALAGCATQHYAVVGSFDDHNELFIGEIANNPWNGTQYVEVTGVNSGIKCAGVSKDIAAPKNLLSCAGYKGEAELLCDDGRKIKSSWETLGCAKGSGKGYDGDGNSFTYTFGMKKDEALKIIEQQVNKAKSKTTLPTIEKNDGIVHEKGVIIAPGYK